ncbi:glutaredoxin [Entomophthora muscae]|uniref:Glutaredoxin n=1 Tax=Entomophthora muscae TaxID=34485 RepID=A0ACC2TKH4_9FUNG|nr:glutaredoxin [Entomophthora muscae]
MPSVQAITSEEEFKTLVRGESEKNSVFAVYFWASWAQPCAQMKEVFHTLSTVYPQLKYLEVEAEELPELSESFEVDSVPYFVFIKVRKILAKVSGANASELSSTAEKFAKALGATARPPSEASSLDLNSRLKQLISQEHVMIFIKGSPQQPKCGFSRQLIEILKEQGIVYGSFDILSDDGVRQGLKKFSNWPTYPQVYVKGELIGGLDIIRELIDDSEFLPMIPESSRIPSN